MAPETGPFWHFKVPEIVYNIFGNLWCKKSPFPGNLWHQKLHHSGDFCFRILKPEIAKMVQFLGPAFAISGSFPTISVFLLHLAFDNI
jgi:hypothetical protein